MKQVLIILCFLISLSCHAQDFSLVDSIVIKYPDKFKSIEDFSNAIENDFDKDLDKVRAAYFWISNHVSYDYETLKNKTNVYKRIAHNDEDDYQKQLAEMQRNYAERVLKKQTGICEGYAQLLKFTLETLGIQCEVVEGFTNTDSYHIGRRRGATDHAWNSVKIGENWYLIDATWSTGNYEHNPKVFNFNDTYFLIKPEKMILNHYPKDPKWQLLKKPYSKSVFINLPVIKKPYFNSDLEIQKDSKGTIKVKYAKKITLYFDSIDENRSYFYSFKDFNYSYPLEFTKTKKGYKTQIGFKSNRNSELHIVVADYTAIVYRVILQK